MRQVSTAAALIACIGLAACAGGNGQGSAEALRANQAAVPSTSSNGGGQRALGNTPSVGVTSGPGGSGTSVGLAPNTKGPGY